MVILPSFVLRTGKVAWGLPIALTILLSCSIIGLVFHFRVLVLFMPATT